MSVINKMLQDLDRRQAGPGKGGPAQPHVQAVAREARGREWFWRTLAILLFATVAWVAWMAYQMFWPGPLATQLAYRSAAEARAREALARAVPPKPPPVPESPPAAEPVVAKAAEIPVPPAPPETFRLAKSIASPIVEPAAKASAPKPASGAPDAGTERGKVERRDRVSTPAERAENEFRYAAAVLKLGRGTEAEAHFEKALEIDPGHRDARQALVALRLEGGDLDGARQLLEEGLKLDAGQPDFAMALARILIERNDLPGALAALDGSAAAASSVPEFHLMRGTVLQRLGRHAEAAEAYRTALRQQSAIPQAWVGLGISLEALHQRPEASQAFRQALAAGPINSDLKAFVDERIRALR
jgi:MSHA biogenesis protein MshN